MFLILLDWENLIPFIISIICFVSFSIMFRAIDSGKEQGTGPLKNNQPQVALFFIFFVIIFSFFFLNIFVALIILTFQEQGEAEEGDCEIDRNQVKGFSLFI